MGLATMSQLQHQKHKQQKKKKSTGRIISTLKFLYLMQRTDSLEKTLMLGKIEGRRRRG